jgi:hypothetical protein
MTVAVACAPVNGDNVRERLDERTGVTVTSMDAALQFYSPQPERGLQATSFAYLGPIEINRMGQRQTYLWLSVLLGEEERDRDSPPTQLVLQLRVLADGATLEPQPVSSDRGEIGLGHRVYERPADWVGEAYYAISSEQLAQLAAADTMMLEIVVPGAEPRRYEAWKADLSGLRSFVKRIGPDSP